MKKAAPVGNGLSKQIPRSKIGKKIRYSKSDEVKMLEGMANQAARDKLPTVPHLAPRIFRDDSANGLTKCIITFLRLTKNQAERISSTGRPMNRTLTFVDVLGNRRTIGNFEWITGTGTRGTADISATIAGRSVKIEVKAGKDRQSQHQKDYQQQIEAAGGIYTIARTFQEFFQWYTETFKDHAK